MLSYIHVLCLLLCLSCVLRVCKLFGETIRNVFAILLLNVMDVYSVGEGRLNS